MFHLAEPNAWAARTETSYCPEAFAAEGFVHLSTAEQVLSTAQRYYAGRKDMLLLCVDVERLPLPLVYENLLGGAELFPHYYDEIPLTAVRSCEPLQLLDDGQFCATSLR